VIESDEEYRAWIYLGISEGAATPIFLFNPGRETFLAAGATAVQCTVSSVPLPLGRYYLWAAAYERWTNGPELLAWQPLAQFSIYGPELDAAPRAIVRLSPVHVDSTWSTAREGG
jgi:hypothetical protein